MPNPQPEILVGKAATHRSRRRDRSNPGRSTTSWRSPACSDTSDTSNTGIAQESAGIDFANLFVGESYNLLAPKPAAAGTDCAGTRLRHPMSGDSLMRRQKT